MSAAKTTKRYAKALLDFSIEKKQEETVYNDMLLIVKIIEQNQELKQVLISPVIKSSQKQELIETIVKNLCEETKKLVRILVENKRINLIQEIASDFIDLYNKYKQKQTAIVVTAVPISEELRVKILDKVQQITGNKDVSLKNEINESIIGGFILRLGDLQYNASISHRISAIERNFESNFNINL